MILPWINKIQFLERFGCQTLSSEMRRMVSFMTLSSPICMSESSPMVTSSTASGWLLYFSYKFDSCASNQKNQATLLNKISYSCQIQEIPFPLYLPILSRYSRAKFLTSCNWFLWKWSNWSVWFFSVVQCLDITC